MTKQEFDILLALTQSDSPMTQRKLAETAHISLGR